MELSSPAPGPLVDEEPPGSSESRREGHQEVTLGTVLATERKTPQAATASVGVPRGRALKDLLAQQKRQEQRQEQRQRDATGARQPFPTSCSAWGARTRSSDVDFTQQPQSQERMQDQPQQRPCKRKPTTGPFVAHRIAEGDGLPRCTKQRAEARSNSHPTPAPALAPDGEKTQSLRASKRRVEELSTRLKHLTYQREAVSEARRTYEEACMLQRRQLLAIHSEREKALLLLQRLLEESAAKGLELLRGVNDKLIAYEVICSTKTLDDPLLAARLPKVSNNCTPYTSYLINLTSSCSISLSLFRAIPCPRAFLQHETDPTSGTGSSNGSGENSCPSKSGDSERIEVVAVKVMEVALTPRTKKRKLAKLAHWRGYTVRCTLRRERSIRAAAAAVLSKLHAAAIDLQRKIRGLLQRREFLEHVKSTHLLPPKKRAAAVAVHPLPKTAAAATTAATPLTAHQARLHRLLNRTAELLQRWQQLRLLNCRDEENMLQSLPQHISTITRLRSNLQSILPKPNLYMRTLISERAVDDP
ncbi:uncharacterized protein LOC113147582 [Cyclospora cayetanensis]|uniref:Uncharacterized protein LOC113147582 n=1 Tax=Cyclospora cayetanensis TaxID=88456 RepID=A0A6P6S3G9_9EIME|nr:uncharacterized protein LOC113147582 [Cyclospora cayetanensis]